MTRGMMQIVYCSKECQKSHWTAHKAACASKSHREQETRSQYAIEQAKIRAEITLGGVLRNQRSDEATTTPVPAEIQNWL